MSQDYSPSLVTKNLVFCGDAAMKSAAGPATLLYDKVNDNNGTMYNGTCVNFDGTDEQVYTGDGPGVGFGALSANDDVTLCAWINVDTSGDMGIISIGNVYMSIIVNGGYLEARCYNSGSQLTNTDAHAIATGTWYHVAGVFSGGNVTLYKDGVATAAVACTNEAIASSAAYFQIGKGYTSGYLWMDGEIANPMAFDTALSANNIKELYEDSKVIIPTKNDASGDFVSQTNLRGWWTFADGLGTVCYDGSGRGIHGEFQNMESADWSTGQTGCPQLVEGYNRPMLFPGATTDYVAVGNTSEFCFGTSDFSFGAWIKTSNTATFNMVFDALQPVNKGWQFGVYGTSPYMRLWASTGSAQVSLDSSTNVCDGQWHHVGFTSYAGSPQLVTLYVDGSADASSGSMGALNMVGGAYASWIGGQVAGPNYPFDGLINEVVLYDALLSSSEMAALAATGPNGGPLPPDPMSGASNLSAASNVKGYWRNDGDVTWTDRSGEGNNGTVGGSPDALLFKQGINGSKNVNTGRDNQGFPLKFKNVGAVGYKGSNYISVPHSSVFDNTAFSYCSWVYVPGDTTTDGKMAHLSRNSSGNGWAVWQLRTVNGATNQVMYQTNSGGTWQTQTYSNFFSGAGWYYVCITHAQGNAAKLYRNGIEVSGSGSCTQDFEFGTEPLYIGCRKSASSFIEFWDGQIANSQYYNRALTYAEIQQNYNSFKSRFGK
jgi:hypothetical protein